MRVHETSPLKPIDDRSSSAVALLRERRMPLKPLPQLRALPPGLPSRDPSSAESAANLTADHGGHLAVDLKRKEGRRWLAA
jgi:hypothetical protein